MITHYVYQYSPFCDKVQSILNVKRIPHRTESIRISDSENVRQLSNKSKLPVIEHSGQYIHDSTEIAYYLEQLFPEPSLVPSSSTGQAKMHLLEDWSDESLNFYMMCLRWLPQNRERWAAEMAAPEPDQKMRNIITKILPKTTLDILDKQGLGRKSEQELITDIRRHFTMLTHTLGDDDFLVENQLSLADISIAVQIGWMIKNPEGEALLNEFPPLQRWLDRITNLTD